MLSLFKKASITNLINLAAGKYISGAARMGHDEMDTEMDATVMSALEASHCRLAAVNAAVEGLLLEQRFEQGCIYALKQLLGHSTLLHVKPCDRIKVRAPPSLSAPPKGGPTSLFTTTHARVQAATDKYTRLLDRLKEHRGERELLELEYLHATA